MSSRLPQVTAREAVAALKRAGFVESNQEGSHLTLKHPNSGRQTTIPMHSGDLGRGLVKAILRQAGLSSPEFRKLL